jgi:hypothetical protein
VLGADILQQSVDGAEVVPRLQLVVEEVDDTHALALVELVELVHV